MIFLHKIMLVIWVLVAVTSSEVLLGDELPDDLMEQEILSEEISSLNRKKESLVSEISDLQQLHQELKSGNFAEDENSLQERYANLSRPIWRAVDCADLLMSGVTRSGVYNIYPFSCKCGSAVRVYCDMDTDGGGWTVFLNRKDQSPQLNFNRTWEDYKNGFGSTTREYWLGNDNLHMMTNSRSYSLRVDVTRAISGSSHILYNTFRVKDESNRYQLELGQRQVESSMTSDCYTNNRNRYFSTYDRDNDGYSSRNCASNGGGGFWYGYYCRIRYPPTGVYGSRMSYSCYTTITTQVTNVQMKIRPTICESASKRINLPHTRCDNQCPTH